MCLNMFLFSIVIYMNCMCVLSVFFGQSVVAASNLKIRTRGRMWDCRGSNIESPFEWPLELLHIWTTLHPKPRCDEMKACAMYTQTDLKFS